MAVCSVVFCFAWCGLSHRALCLFGVFGRWIYISPLCCPAELAMLCPNQGNLCVYRSCVWPSFWGRFGNWSLVVLIAQRCFSLVGLSAYLYVVELDSFYTTIVAIVSLLWFGAQSLWGYSRKRPTRYCWY